MKVIYRISDGGYKKVKPAYVTKRGCFLHFMKVFADHDIYVVADNVSDTTYAFLLEHVVADKIFRTALGNAESFLYSVQMAMGLFRDEERVYFAEDDYLYTKEAPKIIAEGLDVADYSSGYDHPDKYLNYAEGGPNRYIEGGGELTKVILSANRHWKVTNSFCMTFATHVWCIKQDIQIYRRHCRGGHPNDFEMCLDLARTHARKLVSCLPAVSTHGETEYLAPFIDWEQAAKYTL